MAPPSKARPRVAYDLGRRGEALPDDWHDDPELAGGWEMGVDDRDAALAGSDRRHRVDPTDRRHHQDNPPVTDQDRRDFSDEPAASAGGWRPSFNTRPKGGGGGLFLGVIGYALGRAFLEEGPYGMWRWVSAKFRNKVLPRQGAAASSAPVQPSSVRTVST